MTTLISFRRLVSTAHLYNQPAWSTEQNRSVFGQCFSEFGHGHNYEIDFAWRLNPEALDSKVYFPLLEAADKIMNHVCSLYDHHHISFTHAEFKTGGKISTTENLALQIWHEFNQAWKLEAAQISSASPSGVQIWEMGDLASCVGTTPQQALFKTLSKKSYVKQNHRRTAVRLGPSKKPISLQLWIPSGGPTEKMAEFDLDSLKVEAETAISLASLAKRLTRESFVLLCDQEHHFAFAPGEYTE